MNRIPKDKSPMKSISHTGLVPRSLGQPGIPLVSAGSGITFLSFAMFSYKDCFSFCGLVINNKISFFAQASLISWGFNLWSYAWEII